MGGPELSEGVPPIPMISSMTGYGRAQGDCGGVSIEVELRSVNHRFCDYSFKLPRHLAFLESSLKKSLQKSFARGRFDLTVQLESGGKPLLQLSLNQEFAQQYHHLLEQLKKVFGLQDEIRLSHFIGHPSLIRVLEGNGEWKAQGEAVERLFSGAVAQLGHSRLEEGKAIEKELRSILQEIGQSLSRVRKRVPAVLNSYRRKLSARIREISGGMETDRERLAQEVAWFAERSDVTEELGRLDTHLKRFAGFLRAREPVGRSLEFLLQEMVREANTIGAKGNDAAVSHEVVFVKGELEKLRELVQNVE